jgi:hypothetical protein
MTIETNNYQLLPALLDKTECAGLTEKLWSLKELNYFTFDPQCPISYSFYGVLDPLLEKYRETISEIIGVDLLSAYSYTRIYRVGEVLHEHTDRDACEYSVTACLGMSNEDAPWPIFMGEEKLIQEIGDACIYKGCEIEHSRLRFDEEWQAQVFLHYVDANGPNKDQTFDGREHLGDSKDDVNLFADSRAEQKLGFRPIKEDYDDGFFQDIP